MTPTNLHIGWAETLVGALVSAGVADIVVSPGSRSTPLVLAAAARTDVRCTVVVDERSAAFFALGQARASGKPSVLICTSGTAAAHYFPAIIEAATAFVPLVVLTADRPWEDRETGASQTIDQVKMFGDYVRHFVDIGPPDPSPSSFRALARIAAQSVHAALAPTPGPVHVNAQFRKPLEPAKVEGREPWEDVRDALVNMSPTAIAAPSANAVDETTLDRIADACARASRGVIALGPSPIANNADREAVFALARTLGFPLLVEHTSQLRFGAPDETPLFASFDVHLRNPAFRRSFAPDCILQLGAPPTSAGYASLLAENPSVPRFVVAPHGHPDPQGNANAIVKTTPAGFARAIEPKLRSFMRSKTDVWRRAIAHADGLAWKTAAAALEGDVLSEASVAFRAVRALPPGGYFAIGNSNPVRDVDLFVPPSADPLRILHQRGAAGIDGLVSGAAGSASVSKVPTLLLLGDLTMLHDLGGLAVARRATSPLVVVVVQNEGGRIFEELPLRASEAATRAFEPFFATPQNIDFEAAAKAFGVAFARPKTSSELERVLADAVKTIGCTLVEARVPPHDGSERRTRFRNDLSALVAKELA